MPLATNSTPGSIELAGDLTGFATAPQLRNTGVVPGGYNSSNVVIDSKGRITQVESALPTTPDATTSSSGKVQIGSNISVVAGEISVNTATNSVLGVVNSANSSNISISTGDVDVGSNIPKLDTANTFTKRNGLPSTTSASTNYTPNVESFTIHKLTSSSQVTVQNPSNAVSGDEFVLATEVDTTGFVTSEVDVVQFDWTDVAWNGSIFCASNTSASNKAITSPDGVTWTERTSANLTTSQSIAWNGSVFAVVGYSVASGSNTTAATSPDGITWTARTMPLAANWSDVVSDGSQFLAIARSSGTLPGVATTVAATSPDGTTWTSRTLPSSQQWSRAAWNGSVFCAVATSSTHPTFTATTAAGTSPDGITWTARTMPSGSWVDITWNGSVFCAVDGISFTAATSPDGITWTSHTLPTLSAGNYGTVCSQGQILIALSPTQEAAISRDNGITWYPARMPSNYPWAGAVSNGTFVVAVSNNISTVSRAAKIDPTPHYLFGNSYKFANAPTYGEQKLYCVVNGSTVLSYYE